MGGSSYPTNLQTYCLSPPLSAVADEQIGSAHTDRQTSHSTGTSQLAKPKSELCTLADTCYLEAPGTKLLQESGDSNLSPSQLLHCNQLSQNPLQPR